MKRLLALLTAVIFCLAPMVLMAEASSTVCPHYQNTTACEIHRTSYSHSVKLANATGCYMWYWNAYYDCSICNHHWEGLVGDVEPHHFAANGVCPNCGYDSNSD